MGNGGSTHNLQNDFVESELNSYHTTQYLRRTSGETKTKYNQALRDIGWSSGGRNVADCKVLPKPAENLKLRPTTNGAILQAGGTISIRAKETTLELEQNHNTNEPAIFHPMRRCHTLILDGRNESISYQKTTAPLKEFRRSQTLLHVGYNRTKDQLLTNSDNFKQEPPPNTPTTSTLKVNKYTKKRRAPPAPTKTSVAADSGSSIQNLTSETKNVSSGKPRIYATNSNKILLPQKLNKINKTGANDEGTTIKPARPITTVNPSYFSKLPYRREKSFDVLLLRQREAVASNERRPRTPTQNEPAPSKANNRNPNTSRSEVNLNGKQKPLNTTKNKSSNAFANLYRSEAYYQKDTAKDKVQEERFCQEESTKFDLVQDPATNVQEYHSAANERRTKYTQSRIPQLKRTFYFGMESSNKSAIGNISESKKSQDKRENLTEKNEDVVLLNHTMEEEEIVDNGILVHMRPTLPKRQPATPNFSPTAAWRNLLLEQHSLQQERLKIKKNSRIIESPISLRSHTKKHAANWTPEQDLDDEDEDEEEDEEQQILRATNALLKEDLTTEKHLNSNSLHIFSLSLPRDAHLLSSEQENGLKVTNNWLVPGFSSLQKFKTQLSRNPNPKCTCVPNSTGKHNSYPIQNSFGDSSASDAKSNHQLNCDFHKTSTRPANYHNGNWLLHKSKSNDSPVPATTEAVEDKRSKSLAIQPLVNLQPTSLTNICGGKHVVYLPGQDVLTAGSNDTQRSPKQISLNKSNYKRQRQRQEIVRESLQDPKPIQDVQQSNISCPEKNTHRFSFQSTVRVLEKRRLAEKLSKDAEIQEAQRLQELEAMKRVEEDFQRKRAPEKANLRNQLRLHLKANTEMEAFRSLPLNINETLNSSQHPQNRHVFDVNNNLFCRAEPDGAVSPLLDITDNLNKTQPNFPLTPKKSAQDLERFVYDGEESESETQVADLQRAALLIEPYLHSII